MKAKNGKKPHIPTHLFCPTWSETNHQAEKCSKVAGAHLRPTITREKQNARPGNEATLNNNGKHLTATLGQFDLKETGSKNYFSQRLEMHESMSVRR